MSDLNSHSSFYSEISHFDKKYQNKTINLTQSKDKILFIIKENSNQTEILFQLLKVNRKTPVFNKATKKKNDYRILIKKKKKHLEEK